MDTVDLMDRVYQKLMALDTQQQLQKDIQILESYDKHPIVEYNIAMAEPTSDKGTPHHYQLNNGQDLYDLFLEHYNRDIVLAHLELICIEYLLRCRKKGQYASDLRKVQVIMNRIGTILDSTVEEI